MKKQKHFIALFFIVLLTTSCSTKKKTWFNRQFHNTTAKYNGYFNGKESMRLGVKKLHESFKDDYTEVLPVHTYRDLKKATKIHPYMDKAIQKGSVVIQRHSIKIKGKEYCRWIDDSYFLVGKGYFYKGDFEEAIKTFKFIKDEYKRNEIKYNASLWLVRAYAEKKDFTSAEMELEELENDRRFPKKLKRELIKNSIDFYLKQKNYSLALGEINRLIGLTKNKRKNVRYNYIAAQIYQLNKNHRAAKQKYKQVLKSNPEYTMVFNAKMNLAQSLESGSRDTQKMRQQLLKMTKDDKNKEFLDQIYFTLAEMDINNQDTLSAKENYKLSTIKSIKNQNQKTRSFLSLAKIDFAKNDYHSSKTHYDSTVFYMPEGFIGYDQVNETHRVLSDLMFHLNTINMQDSLQFLSKLPKTELDKIINQIIKKEKEKERSLLEQERLQQKIMYENNINRSRDSQFGNNTSGGKWYFYNPATLSFGLSEFRKKWGKRKLEDDWRRKDKKHTSTFDTDTTTLKNNDSATKNKQDPKYYTEKIPKTKEDFDLSNTVIKESLYQAAVIYKEYLQEYKKSTNLLKTLTSRFYQDTAYVALARYCIYLNYREQEKEKEAETEKQNIMFKHPNSIYAKILTKNNFEAHLQQINNKKEVEYQRTHTKYLLADYKSVVNKTNTIENDQYKNKYTLLRAFSYIELKDTTSFLKTLQKILDTNEKGEVYSVAKHLIQTVKNPQSIIKTNQQALLGTPYLYKENTDHMSIFLLPKKGVDINYLKTLLSDHNRDVFKNEVFEISAIMMGLDQHVLMVKPFPSAKKVVSYNETIKTNNKILKQLKNSNYKIIAISTENFKEFYKNRDTEGYYDFFKKNYLANN